MDRRRSRAATAILLAGLACPCTPARAAVRPRFEPTDLEWEDTGIVELDVQVGPVRSPGPWRLVVPDFELDLGVLSWLELDVDGAYAIEGPANGPFSLDHALPDALWPSVKIGIYGAHDDVGQRGAAIGIQIGPKLPIATSSHGPGVESLAVAGRMIGRLTLALNLGAFIDPAPDAVSGRPKGVELGFDLQYDLGGQNRYGMTGEIAGTHFFSQDPDQLQATLGFVWSVRSYLDLSLTGLVGTLSGGDRYGILLGASPKVRLFR